jgi:hypothetical protein
LHWCPINSSYASTRTRFVLLEGANLTTTCTGIPPPLDFQNSSSYLHMICVWADRSVFPCVNWADSVCWCVCALQVGHSLWCGGKRRAGCDWRAMPREWTYGSDTTQYR